MTQIVRVGLLQPVSGFDPRGSSEAFARPIVRAVFERPFELQLGGGTRPVLFTGPLTREDPEGARWSGTVRPDVRFSDGTPLTAELLVECLTREGQLSGTATAAGDRVTFALPRPIQRLDLRLAGLQATVQIERGGRPLGTGPFSLSPDSRPERVRLVRNRHARRPAKADEILFTTYPPDPDGVPRALVRALQAGEVDLTYVLAREHLDQLKNVRKWIEPGSGTGILYFNTERPGLSDARFRRALALAIDRQEIARLFYSNPLTFTATGLLPPMFGLVRDGLGFDLRQARALAAQVPAAPRRLALHCIFGPRPYLPDPRRAAESLARSFAALDVELEVSVAADFESYLPRVRRADYDLVLSGWMADSPDPGEYLEQVLGPDRLPSTERALVADGNLARWRDPRAAAALADLDRRADARRELLALVAEEVPLVPLLYGATVYAYSLRLRGFEPSPLGIPELADVELAGA